MRKWTVHDVMTADVLTAEYDTPPAEVVAAMTAYDVSALAVVDRHDSVLGVITRTDVLNAIEVRPPDRRSRLPWRRPPATPAWTARSAGEMMSAPARTIAPEATLAQAGRLMRRHDVNRLLVTAPDRRLLGVVSAADLLKVHDRPDEAMRADVRQALATLPALDVALNVHDGVVTVAGTVTDARTAALVSAVIRDVPGVTAVRNQVAVVPPAAVPATPATPAGPAPRRQLDGWWPTRRPHRDVRAQRRPAPAAK